MCQVKQEEVQKSEGYRKVKQLLLLVPGGVERSALVAASFQCMWGSRASIKDAIGVLKESSVLNIPSVLCTMCWVSYRWK